MEYSLPTSVNVNGTEYSIRSDYRAILDIFQAIADPDLSREERVLALLFIFYPDFETMPPEDYQGAVDRCFWFINCGKTEKPDGRKHPQLVSWEQDFPYIVAPINRVVGQEIRAMEYMHWWSFMSAYLDIGDCLFAQIVRIRSLKARGKKLNDMDKEWYRENRDLVDIRTAYTDAEDDLLKQWLV